MFHPNVCMWTRDKTTNYFASVHFNWKISAFIYVNMAYTYVVHGIKLIIFIHACIKRERENKYIFIFSFGDYIYPRSEQMSMKGVQMMANDDDVQHRLSEIKRLYDCCHTTPHDLLTDLNAQILCKLNGLFGGHNPSHHHTYKFSESNTKVHTLHNCTHHLARSPP